MDYPDLYTSSLYSLIQKAAVFEVIENLSNIAYVGESQAHLHTNHEPLIYSDEKSMFRQKLEINNRNH